MNKRRFLQWFYVFYTKFNKEARYTYLCCRDNRSLRDGLYWLSQPFTCVIIFLFAVVVFSVADPNPHDGSELLNITTFSDLLNRFRINTLKILWFIVLALLDGVGWSVPAPACDSQHRGGDHLPSATRSQVSVVCFFLHSELGDK